MRFRLYACVVATAMAGAAGLSLADEVPKGAPPANPGLPLVSPPGETTFELRTLSIGPKVYLVRFLSHTGKAWVSTGAKWQLLEEETVPPAGVAGTYEVKLLATELGYTAVRLHKRTGMTWMLRSGRWAVIDEPEQGPTEDKPAR